MEVQGINLDTLGEMKEEYQYPAIVEGRVAHIDGDFVAYECSYDETISWEAIVKKARSRVEHIRKLCAASSYRIHLTANGSTKGGRYEQAMLREYQATRKSDKPTRLEQTREYMRDEMKAMYWLDREADDGMAQANYMAAQFNSPHLSVIYSRDKDLKMVPGYHLDADTNEVVLHDSVGEVHLKAMKSSKKVVGTGPLFFFAQMLMGDQADNIGGLPGIYGVPTVKPGTKCGPVATYNLISSTVEGCPRHRVLLECFRRVATLYRNYGETVGFKHWRDGTDLHWKDAFYSEARLLWMRRNTDKDDVVKWLTELTNAA